MTPTKLLLTAAFLLTSSAARAAPTDWRTSFASDAVASYLTGDGLALVVVPGGKRPKDIKAAKAAAAALTAAVGKAKGKKSLVKAPVAPLAKLEDADIVARLKKSKANHVLIVRVAPGEDGTPSATVSVYDMDGTALDSFTAVAGTALAAKTEATEKAGGEDAKAPADPTLQPETTDTASASPGAESPAGSASSSEAHPDSAATALESKSGALENTAEPAPTSSPALAGDTGAVTTSSSPESDATVTASASAPAPLVTPPSTADAEPSEMKLRLGVNTGALYFVPGPSYGVVFSARGGLRLNDWFGAYVDGTWGAGLGVSAASGTGTGSVAVNAASYRRFALMGEATWGVFFVAAGPALVQGAWGGVKANVSTTNGGSAQAYAADGNFPGLVARAGFQFGSRNRFTLALEVSAVLGEVSEADVSDSGEGVKTGDRALAYSPVLMLGWDLN